VTDGDAALEFDEQMQANRQESHPFVAVDKGVVLRQARRHGATGSAVYLSLAVAVGAALGQRRRPRADPLVALLSAITFVVTMAAALDFISLTGSRSTLRSAIACRRSGKKRLTGASATNSSKGVVQ